jgi:hypothetical protein
MGRKLNKKYIEADYGLWQPTILASHEAAALSIHPVCDILLFFGNFPNRSLAS